MSVSSTAGSLWRTTRPPEDASDVLLAYIVLLACRALYAIEHGRQISKSNAGRWLAQSHPAWASLAETSVWVNELGEAPDDRRIRPAVFAPRGGSRIRLRTLGGRLHFIGHRANPGTIS